MRLKVQENTRVRLCEKIPSKKSGSFWRLEHRGQAGIAIAGFAPSTGADARRDLASRLSQFVGGVALVLEQSTAASIAHRVAVSSQPMTPACAAAGSLTQSPTRRPLPAAFGTDGPGRHCFFGSSLSRNASAGLRGLDECLLGKPAGPLPHATPCHLAGTTDHVGNADQVAPLAWLRCVPERGRRLRRIGFRRPLPSSIPR